MATRTRSTVSPTVTPWRSVSPDDRRERYEWFVRTDLGLAEAVTTLCDWTGREEVRGGYISTGLELGRNVVAGGQLRRRTFIAWYEGVQRNLRQLESLVHELRGDTRSNSTLEARAAGPLGPKRANAMRALDVRLRFSRGLRFLESALEDVRLSFAREEGELWAGRRRELRRVFVSPRQMMEPPSMLSESLIGELAIGVMEKMAEAKRSGLCIICGNVWFDTDGRGRRKLCERDECQVAHRRRQRRPELAATVRARQQRYRQRRASRLAAGDTTKTHRSG